MGHVAGCSLEALSGRYATAEHPAHRSSIHRHVRDHVTEANRASYLADIPLQELATVVSQMLIASGANDGNRTAVLAGRAVEVLREIGHLSGELS
jgi:hypothetical protein